MMPQTVPNRPMKGETEATVASQFMLRSNFVISSLMPSWRLRSMAADCSPGRRAAYLPLHLAIAEIEHGDQRSGSKLFACERDGL